MSLFPDYTWHILVFALLTTLSTTVVGLPAIWMALGRGHWFLRVAAVAAILSLLLFVPAHEPLIVSVIQLLAAVPVLVVARRWRARGGGEPIWQFSLSDLLLLTLVVAVIAAVGASVPGRIWQKLEVLYCLEGTDNAVAIPAWSYYLILGITAGLLTILAAWIVWGRCWRWVRQVVFLLVMPVTIGIVGWILEKGSLWPHEPRMFALGTLGPFEITVDEVVFLGATLSIVPLTVWLWLISMSGMESSPGGTKDGGSSGPRWWQWLARVAAVVWSVILLAPLLWAYCVIVAPPAIPETVLPEPNGHTRLVALGKRLENVTIPDYNPTLPPGQSATQQDYLDFEQQHRELFVEVRKAIDLPSCVPVRYDFQDMERMSDVSSTRQLGRGLRVNGKALHIQGSHAEAVQSHVDIIRLGRSVGRGGLIVDWLVGMAIEGIGTHALSADRNQIPAAQRRQLIETLQKLGEDGEPPELVQRREEIWSMHAFGWPGRIVHRIDAFLGQNAVGPDLYRDVANRARAYHRILLVELALENYHDAHGHYPKTLDGLVPDALAELPADPFTGGQLQYRQYRVTGQGFLVYSVGPNKKDDGGTTSDFQPPGDDVRFDP
ncbi:MAG: hypothetical protein GX621_13260 [Pirellulaceae bacterium]|nr:hypothetical protein [Pirellulaceae bacterium]